MIDLSKDAAQLAQWPTAERIAALKRIIPCSTLKRILKQGGTERRFCPRLPDWFMVWFITALGLFCSDCYRQVYRWLQRYRGQGTPGRSTLCEARRRLGVAPLRRLVQQVVHLLATPHTPNAFYRGLRLMAIDGFVVDLPDSEANAHVFGRPGNQYSPGAFPQARVVTLCEIGTHVLWRFLIKPYTCSEVPMATPLLRFLESDMLLLWDRNFLSYAHVSRVRQRQAQMLGRVQKGPLFPPLCRFPDGSYLAKMYPSAKHRRQDRAGIEVRIIDYTFDDAGRPGSGEPHRLLTTLLDWKKDPARRLILLYHERWEEELAIDELKTHQRQRPVLRSETPMGVVQELHGLLLGHYVVRRLMFEAATQQDLPPRRLSFTNTLKILRCRLPEAPISRQGLQRWYENLLEEVGKETLEQRRDRVNPRVLKRTGSPRQKKRPEHRRYPQPRKKMERSIVMLC